jgi:hypothetical protein
LISSYKIIISGNNFKEINKGMMIMTDEKWNVFISTGKINDYLEYKNSARKSEDGEINGNADTAGYSSEGISGR